MTPEEKAKEYLSEYSKEKAIDVAETMRWYAKEFKEFHWFVFWGRVIKILKYHL